jgi:1-acyl-sn-glycerol-3-phosphate acyltransferase
MDMQKIAHFVLCRLLGWEISGKLSGSIKKAVIIVAPHTSLWDFVYGRLAFWILDIPVRFMITQKYFKWPLGWLLTRLGGQPVKQSRPTRLLLEISGNFKNNDNYFLVITPEGTRELTSPWKKGFYQIAMQNHVPVIMAFIDYKYKKGGIGPAFHPTGDFDADMEEIEAFYRLFNAKHPDRYNLSEKNLKKAS